MYEKSFKNRRKLDEKSRTYWSEVPWGPEADMDGATDIWVAPRQDGDEVAAFHGVAASSTVRCSTPPNSLACCWNFLFLYTEFALYRSAFPDPMPECIVLAPSPSSGSHRAARNVTPAKVKMQI